LGLGLLVWLAGCSSPMLSGEAAFAYFFFDLANCIQDDGGPIL